jgi:hypothetical protein
VAGGDRRNADPLLIAALAGGATNQDAARRAGVSEKTVYRRLDDPTFRQQVADARAGLVTRAVAMLAEAGTEAVRTLRALLADGTPPAVRLGAARAVLELGTRLRESEELERRLAALEEQQAALAAHQREEPRWRA